MYSTNSPFKGVELLRRILTVFGTLVSGIYPQHHQSAHSLEDQLVYVLTMVRLNCIDTFAAALGALAYFVLHIQVFIPGWLWYSTTSKALAGRARGAWRVDC